MTLHAAVGGAAMAALLCTGWTGDGGAAPGFAVERDTLLVQPGESVVCLERGFVLSSTLVVRELERTLAEGQHYALDPDAGCLTLLEPDTLGFGRILTVEYQTLPMTLLGVYRLEEDPHRKTAVRASAPGKSAGASPTFTPEENTEGLSISGSKTFGVEIGSNQDLKLRQSLDLRLVGRVSNDVSLLAILSDQDVPFQPEGNTTELSDLDRVLVQIQSPRAGASLGDVGLSYSGTAFLEVQRELEGFAGHASLASVNARGSLASAKGEFTTLEFFGQDGKQGPYRLTDRAGNTDIVVVAGSERVWLDGISMTRGAEEDYVIDYSLGEITFSTRRPISANSEITVDYQYSTGRYQRRIAFVGSDGTIANLGTLQAGFFSEGDDADDPVGGALSPSERAELAALGDSARISGGTKYVGPGMGDYQLSTDPATGREIFVFVDGAGDYEVTFVNVGEGKGEYAPAGSSGDEVFFTFVGAGEGAFIPRRDLPAPEEKHVVNLRWDTRGERGHLSLEGAVSEFDGNVLSTLDDEDNQGGAFLAEGEVRDVDLGGDLRLNPSFRWRRVGDSFQSPGRLRSGFYGREWNLTGTEPVRDENLQELGVGFRWGDRFRWSLEGGHLALADTFTAYRQNQSLGWSDPWVLAGGSWVTTWNRVGESDGKLDRQSGEVTLRRWKVQPRVRGLHETRRRVRGDGERHRDWEAALAFPLAGLPVRAEVGGGRRLDDSLQVATGGWRGVRDARRGFGSLQGSTRNLSFLLRYEARRVTGAGAGNERQDTARLDLRHQAGRGSWNGVMTADVGTVGLRRRTKEITPDSTGFYDEFGKYVGPGGGYDVQYGPPGEETLAGTVFLSTRLRWSPPGPEVGMPSWLRRFAWDGFVNLNESSSLPLVQPRYFLDPGSYLNRESTLDGRLNTRQTVDLFPAHRPLGVRLQQDLRRRMTRNPQGNGQSLVEIQNEDTYTATLRSNPGRGWDAELEGSLGSREDEIVIGSGSASGQETRIRAATVRGGRRFEVIRGRGRFSTDVTLSRETGEDREATGWVFKPRLQWTLSGTGRVDVRYSLTELTTRRGFDTLRGIGAPFLTEGWRLDVISEIRLQRNIVLSGVFGIDRPRNLSRVNQGRLEIRGTF